MPNNPAIRIATTTDAPGIARVQIDGWRSAYRGIVPDATLDGMEPEEVAGRWARGIADLPADRYLYVAENEAGRITGFTMAGPNREDDAAYTGEIYAIYVLPECQGQGIGKVLVQASTARLAAAGSRSLIIWALADNPYRRFYEKLGGLPVRERKIEIGGAMLAEIGYGWEDTVGLIRK